MLRTIEARDGNIYEACPLTGYRPPAQAHDSHRTERRRFSRALSPRVFHGHTPALAFCNRLLVIIMVVVLVVVKSA